MIMPLARDDQDRYLWHHHEDGSFHALRENDAVMHLCEDCAHEGKRVYVPTTQTDVIYATKSRDRPKPRRTLRPPRWKTPDDYSPRDLKDIAAN